MPVFLHPQQQLLLNPLIFYLCFAFSSPHLFNAEQNFCQCKGIQNKYCSEIRQIRKTQKPMLKQKNLLTKMIPPCVRFGLDIKRLQIEQLLKLRIYRRLYKIVANDQTSSKDQFRPHLIKELYFLLQITPFIQSSLQQEYLEKIEEWYNSNDHKKINLSKNLQSIMDNICKGKSKTKLASKKFIDRPKSGVVWDTSINSFLRPYTAKMKKKSQNKLRPESSQFGMSSTAAFTNLSKNNADAETGQKENNDIEEEWARSQDFKKKFRTLHPQQQPTYQKLMNLINRINNHEIEEDKFQLITEKRFDALSSTQKRPLTTMMSSLANSNLKETTIKNKAESQTYEDIEHQEFGNQIRQQDNVGVCEESDGEDSQEQMEENVNKQGIFQQDSRNRRNISFKERIMAMKFFGKNPPKQNDPFFKLYKMNMMQNQNKIIGTREDDEYLNHHIAYTKQKTFIKKEIARKTSSKQLFSKIKTPKENYRKQRYQFLTHKQSQQTVPVSPKIIRMQKIHEVEDKPFYNVKQFFTGKVKRKLQQYFKTFKKEEDELKPQQIYPLTKHQRFFSEKKFDPFHKDNLIDYNKEVIEDIVKIKQKLGGNKIISTEMLMKALYVDAPLASEEEVEWEKFDKKSLMIQKEPHKKKTKKQGRLKKKQSILI